MFELIVYTASDSKYANIVLDAIEKNKKYFAHRLYSEHCLKEDKKYSFKYLELLCQTRNLKNVIIVDNTVSNFAIYIRNGIPIKDYRCENDDIELIHLANYLTKFVEVDDIRELIRMTLKPL